MDAETDEWADYETGPFCRHWRVAWDSDRACERCGHRCDQHREACDEPACTCAAWVGEVE